jgi:hypothetical protein
MAASVSAGLRASMRPRLTKTAEFFGEVPFRSVDDSLIDKE